MKLTVVVTKEGLVFQMEDVDGETMELGPVKKTGYQKFLAAVDSLDDAVSAKEIGASIELAEAVE